MNNFKQTYGNNTTLDGFLLITKNLQGIDPITNLNGLNHLKNIQGELIVNQNPELLTLNDLNSELKVEKGIVISKNEKLENLEILKDITNEHLDRFKIEENNNLITITPPKSLESITDNLSFYSNPKMIINGAFDALSYSAKISLSDSGNFKDLSFLPNLRNIDGGLFIINNTELASLQGLENLYSIDGELIISENVSLKNIEALKNATISSYFLRIKENDALTSLKGLDGFTSGELIIIEHNKSLIDFTGLNQLESFSRIFSIGANESLKSLTGLEKLGINSDQTSSFLFIAKNSSLNNFCAIQNFFIKNPSIMEITTFDNAYNPTREQILDSETCANQNLSISTVELKNDFILYPNPVVDNLYINSKNHIKITSLEIFDLSGKKTKIVDPSSNVIDLSNIPSGIYFATLESSKGKITKKIVVQ